MVNIPLLCRDTRPMFSFGGSSGGYPTTPAGNLFVSTTGNDSNLGTEVSPFRTINKAASVVNPGDVVVVEDGIWSDVHTALGTASVVEVGRGGTAGNLVTFRSRNYLGAKLDGLNGDGFGGSMQGFNFRNGAGFVKIQGFDIYGMASTTGSCAGIDVFGGGADSVISLNQIHHCGRICIAHGFGQNGIFIGQSRVMVERNTIFDIGRLGPTEGCGTPGPYQTNDHGIYHSSGDDFTARNNILYAADHGWSIQFFGTTRSRTRILNNTFTFGNQYQNRTHMVLDVDMIDAVIANNIFYDTVLGNTLKVFASTRTFTNVVVQNNLTSSAQMSDNADPGISLVGNLVSTNPLLVDPLTDFRLQVGSPAIDAGISLTDVLDDFNGTARPIGAAYDIGAYEK